MLQSLRQIRQRRQSNMFKPHGIILLQLLLCIYSSVSVSILEAIVYRDNIPKTTFVLGMLFVSYYYLTGGIILFLLSNMVVHTPYWKHHRTAHIMLHITCSLYDIGVAIITILGYVHMIPALADRNRIHYDTAFIILYVIYQLGVTVHTSINIRYIKDYKRLQGYDDVSNRVHPDEERATPYIHGGAHESYRVLRVKNVLIDSPPTSETYCCICMENVVRVSILPCKHREFCLRCIEYMYEQRCPLCRTEFVSVENELVSASTTK